MALKEQHYYFCDDKNCDVVYYAADDTIITKSMLRDRVGIKEPDDNALICYCFGVTRAQARSNKSIKAFVIEQTKNARCTCKTSNPSGRCCLKDFPK